MHRAWWYLVVAVGGVLLGHQVTYERLAPLSGEHAGMTMASQSWLPSIPTLLVVSSLGLFLAVALARRFPNVRLSPRMFLAAQTLVFVVVETLDRAVNGCCLYPTLPVAVLGLAAQLLPAMAVFAILALAFPLLLEQITRTWLEPVRFAASGLAPAVSSSLLLRSLFLSFLLPARGPPLAA